ncbi:P-loop ATPase, Sll1717 family [Limnofasciculus baicalensis]|uniref:ParA family protein n=1 Tax=Limnofasciculus baicalensis BBK-W-15 TaxID=2699891 RepID=A0AAE3GVI0_9CYAN|nr:ParA family protein [Limnofasciculus baicalensis]MCP2730548.1 ParA family protein [Limnofasciculus baicalensis BBK-W-15]
MNHAEIKERIEHNMANTNLEINDLRVQPDPFIGWRIAIVSSGFEGKIYEERKEIVLKGLEELTIEGLDLLTPIERKWAGNLPIDSTLEDIPLWPEALARSKNPQTVLFPSDLDEDLDRPIIATFYSLRGGVGRSTALAYTARILASRGRTVLCVDMDLEAPGLAALFGKENEISEGQGLLSILLALDQGEKPDIRNHILRISETDELYCLPPGIPDANYARLLNFIDPAAWYREERNPLRELIQMLGKDLPFKPDVILLDARTGITPLNAPLLFDLADLAIIVFFPHPQTQIGTAALVRALLAAKTQRSELQLTPEPRFLVSPIPASKAPEVIERYENRALKWISDWLAVLDDKRSEVDKIIESEITHFVHYREAIATSDRILVDREIWREFNPVAEWLERFLPTPSEQRQPVSLSNAKNQILSELEFSAGTAEYQNNLIETFVETELVNRAIEPRIPLVIGRKGTGKTAIFRRIMENYQKPSIVVLSPGPLRGNRPWIISPDGFKAIEETLTTTGVSWREFWTIQTCLSCHLSWQEQRPQPNSIIAEILTEEPDTELGVVECIEGLLKIDRIGLLARDWLSRLDKIAQPDTILLLDGLDTGFGSTQSDRERRTRAIEGLLSLITDFGDNLQKLKFKLLLREDIWRKLRFENKSHFFGRSVTLTWVDKAELFKVVIKQALRSSSFRQLIGSTDWGSLFPSDDYWTESQLFEVWNMLVGERMQGGKSAFTRNWVWNRLVDGNGNRSPRALLQLFVAATAWEKREHQRNYYGKTLIRAKALSASLEEVSKQALDALVKEEFPELQGLIDQLKELGYSPFKATELLNLDEALSLAREVGLLAVYEGTEDEVQRYKVPDIYRLGIGMTRKGQA